MPDLRPLVRDLRRVHDDPHLQRMYELLAAELITTTSESDRDVLDPDFLELSADERSAFIVDCAIDLAPRLRDAAFAWAMLHMVTVADWKRRRGE